MDKPDNMSDKDYLMRVMSLRTNIPLKTIDAIVSHQMEVIYDAFGQHQTVEISGFGKFLFNKNKALKKWEKNLSKEKVFREILEREDITDVKRKSVELKLQNTLKWIEGIKNQIKKCQQS